MSNRRAAVLGFVLLAVLLWSVAYPNASVVVDSFGHGLGYWREFVHSPADREALWTSLWISVASVVGATAVGVPLAFLLTRAEFRGRRVLQACAALPAALPPLVGVIAFLFLYGESGVITRFVQLALGRRDPPWTLSGGWSIVFVHAYTMYVYVYLFVAAGLERVDASLEEAAMGLGAGTWRRLCRVTIPLLTPALAGATLLVFMGSLGSFSAPYIFGGGLRVLATQIVTSRLNGAPGIASVETTVLAVSAVLALAVSRWIEGRRQYVGAVKGGTRVARRPLRARWVRVVLPLVATVMVAILLLPHAMILLVSFAKDGAWTTQVLPPAYTLSNYQRLVSEASLVAPIRNSVLMAALATFGTVVVCATAAYLLVLQRVPGRRLLALLVALPWAIPATAVAIGLASTFNTNSPLTLRFLLVGTFWILPLAYFVRGVPLVASAVQGSLRQMDASLEDAARGLGAGWWLTLRKVLLPAAGPGLVAGATLAAITAVGDFVASVVLYTHANRPISIEILAQLRDFSFGTAAAYSVVLIGIVVVITLVTRLIAPSYQGQNAAVSNL